MNNIIVIGSNYSGEFGLNHTNPVTKLTQLDQQNKSIKNILPGLEYTIYTDYNNNLYATGNNKYGSCAIGNNDDNKIETLTILSPIDYFKINNIKINKICVSIGGRTTFWISDKNNVYCNGYNHYGQFGLNHNNNNATPEIIEELSDNKRVIDMQSSGSQGFALCTSLNNQINLIIKYWSRQYKIPNEIQHLMILFSKTDNYGNVYATIIGEEARKISEYKWQRIEVFKKKTVIKMKTGSSHCLYLESNGRLWCTGYFYAGALGIGHVNRHVYKPVIIEYFNNIKIKDINCGNRHSLVIDENNNIYSWGANHVGQCGDGTLNDIWTPKLIQDLKDYDIIDIDCGSCHSYCKTSDNKHFLFGANNNNECITNDNVLKVKEPHCINKIIDTQFHGKIIKSVFLGCGNTSIILN